MAEGQEKTESATPKRREEARRKGQVPKSQEVNNLFGLLGVFLTIRIFAGFLFTGMSEYTKKTLQSAGVTAHVPPYLMMDHIRGLIQFAMHEILVILAPVLIVAVAAGILSNVIQVGLLLSPEALTLKFDKLDPLKGLGRVFSAKSFIEVFKGVLKIFFVMYIAWISMKGDLRLYLNFAQADIRTMMLATAMSIFNMVLRILVALLALALFDYVYQRYEHEKSLKMTKQEVKDEYKQREGDPHIKARIRERMRALATQKMLADVPKADVVITNPTHYAIALSWTEDLPAPKVLAKGQGIIALRIREEAEKAGVMIVEDPPLAQALFKSCEAGEWIPADMFRAVAKVLAFVYKAKGRMPHLAQQGAPS